MRSQRRDRDLYCRPENKDARSRGGHAGLLRAAGGCLCLLGAGEAAQIDTGGPCARANATELPPLVQHPGARAVATQHSAQQLPATQSHPATALPAGPSERLLSDAQ